MPCSVECHRIKTGLFIGVLLKILGRKAKIAAKRVRGLKIHSMAAKLAVSTLLIMLVIGCVEIQPGPPSKSRSTSSAGTKDHCNTSSSEKVSETERILTAISEIKNSQTDLSKNLTSKLTSMEKSINDNLEDIRCTQAAITEDILELSDTCENLKRDNDLLQTKVEHLEEKLDYMENYSRRNNLIVHGIPQQNQYETWEETENKIMTMIRDRLKITASLHIERAHRIGKAIIVRFLSFKDRELVFSQAKLLKGCDPPIFIRPDVSEKVRQKIQGLLHMRKEYTERNQRATIRHDKLHTSDGVFTFNLNSQTIEKVSGGRRRGEQPSDTQARKRHVQIVSHDTSRGNQSHSFGEHRLNSLHEEKNQHTGNDTANRDQHRGAISNFRGSSGTDEVPARRGNNTRSYAATVSCRTSEKKKGQASSRHASPSLPSSPVLPSSTLPPSPSSPPSTENFRGGVRKSHGSSSRATRSQSRSETDDDDSRRSVR